MDANNPSGIEHHLVKEGEREGKAVRIVCGDRTYDADIAKVWDAIANSERLAHWFAPVSGDLKLGGRYQVKGNAGGEIVRCEQPTALDITWEFGGNVSWVTLRLESIESKTKLTLQHIMGKDDESEAHWKKYGPGATGVGWELGFMALGQYLTTGEPVNEAENNQWLTSPDGKTFLQNCATAWGDAHIESGEDSTVATAMADATAAFYCGTE